MYEVLHPVINNRDTFGLNVLDFFHEGVVFTVDFDVAYLLECYFFGSLIEEFKLFGSLLAD